MKSSNISKPFPTNFNKTCLVRTIAVITIALGAIATVTSVLAILAVSGVHLGPLNALQTLHLAGSIGLMVGGTGLVLSPFAFLVINVILSNKRKALKNDHNTYADKKRSVEEKLKYQLECAQPKSHGEVSNKSSVENGSIRIDSHFDIQTEFLGDESIGASETQGRRREMEDVHFAQTLTLNINGEGVEAKLIAVCDGHGDKKRDGFYIKEHLKEKLQQYLTSLDANSITEALTCSILELDKELLQRSQENELCGGTTLTAALIIDDFIYTPNVGDSRTIFCDRKKIIQLSEDAKPEKERFQKAVGKEGGRIDPPRYSLNDPWRANGFSVARDLGANLPGKPKITRIPYPEKGYLVLACDGLWDVFNNAEVQKAVYDMHDLELSTKQMAAKLVDLALESDSLDNISVVVIKL